MYTILDTILNIHETVRSALLGGGIWLGLDLNKAFDRLEHAFLGETLSELGFGKYLYVM